LQTQAPKVNKYKDLTLNNSKENIMSKDMEERMLKIEVNTKQIGQGLAQVE
jgi:hypothetical protein